MCENPLPTGWCSQCKEIVKTVTKSIPETVPYGSTEIVIGTYEYEFCAKCGGFVYQATAPTCAEQAEQNDSIPI